MGVKFVLYIENGVDKFIEYYIFELGVFFVLYIKMEFKNLLIINFWLGVKFVVYIKIVF